MIVKDRFGTVMAEYKWDANPKGIVEAGSVQLGRSAGDPWIILTVGTRNLVVYMDNEEIRTVLNVSDIEEPALVKATREFLAVYDSGGRISDQLQIMRDLVK